MNRVVAGVLGFSAFAVVFMALYVAITLANTFFSGALTGAFGVFVGGYAAVLALITASYATEHGFGPQARQDALATAGVFGVFGLLGVTNASASDPVALGTFLAGAPAAWVVWGRGRQKNT